ncbi:MAG: sugar transferase [Candidatus Gracilibacteria bacterium]
MKKVNIYFTITKIFSDFLIIFLTFFLAREIRLITDLIPSINLPVQTISIEELFKFSLIGAFVLITIFLIHGLYRFDSTWGRIKEFSKILIYSFYSFVFFTVIVYLGQGFIFHIEIPRLIIGFTFLFGSVFLIIERLLISFVVKILFKRGLISKSRIFIISSKSCKESNSLIKSFINSHEYKVVGLSKGNKDKFDGIDKINFDDLKRMIKSRKIDEILYVRSSYKSYEISELWELIRIFGIKYRYIANSFDLAKSNTAMSLVNDIPALEIKNTSLSEWSTILKRIFDFFAGLIGVIIFSPILLIVGLLIKIEDPKGPIIFRNKRVGKLGKKFDLFKFRYMKWEYCIKDSYNVSKNDKKKALRYEKELIKSSSSRSGPLYKIKNDPRKTRIGSFIEKYSIDELPQFFNLILGNMSLIGPRPHQSREVDKYQLKHIRLLTIKPGITGMSQVNGRETNSFDDEANLDIYYIENWNILLDLKILFKTLYVVLSRK